MNILLPVDPTWLKSNGSPKRNCPYEVKLNNFINKANIKYDWKYDYSKVVWVSPVDPVIITCPIHGDFTQKPHDHFGSKHGCQKCGNDKLCNHPWKTSETDYIEKAVVVHANYYTYPNLNFKSLNDKINVECPIHGEFQTHPRSHLLGEGKCRQCFRRNTGFYSHGYFNNHPEQKTVLGKLYFVKMYNNTEEFYKIGITKHGAYHRFYVVEKLPYSLDIIKEVEMPLYDAYCKEQLLLEKYSDCCTTPLIDFPGRTECLNADIRDEI